MQEIGIPIMEISYKFKQICNFMQRLVYQQVRKLKGIMFECNWTKCLKNQPRDVIKMRDCPSLFYGFSFPLFLSSPSFL